MYDSPSLTEGTNYIDGVRLSMDVRPKFLHRALNRRLAYLVELKNQERKGKAISPDRIQKAMDNVIKERARA